MYTYNLHSCVIYWYLSTENFFTASLTREPQLLKSCKRAMFIQLYNVHIDILLFCIYTTYAKIFFSKNGLLLFHPLTSMPIHPYTIIYTYHIKIQHSIIFQFSKICDQTYIGIYIFLFLTRIHYTLYSNGRRICFVLILTVWANGRALNQWK